MAGPPGSVAYPELTLEGVDGGAHQLSKSDSRVRHEGNTGQCLLHVAEVSTLFVETQTTSDDATAPHALYMTVQSGVRLCSFT